MKKLPLKLRKKHPHDETLKQQPIDWKATLPFLENTRGYLIHRPVSVTTYRHWIKPHIAAQCYCGITFSGDKNLSFLSVPPENGVVCQRCEDIAVSAGLPSSSSLAGKHVHTGGLKVVLSCGCKER